jgi:hypothetical protein
LRASPSLRKWAGQRSKAADRDDTTLVCVECDALAETKARALEAHLADVHDDGEDEVVFICARCAHREFHRQDLVDPPLLD